METRATWNIITRKQKKKSQDGASMTTTTQEGKTRIFLSYKSVVIVETDRYRFVPLLFGSYILVFLYTLPHRVHLIVLYVSKETWICVLLPYSLYSVV